jgi:hypothetical protein
VICLAQYAFAVGGAGHITLRSDWSYKTRVYEDVFNDARLVQPGFGIVNAYASFTTQEVRWVLALFAGACFKLRMRDIPQLTRASQVENSSIQCAEAVSG